MHLLGPRWCTCSANWVQHFLLCCCKPEVLEFLAERAVVTGSCVWGYGCMELQACNTLCNISLEGSVAEMLHSVCLWHPYADNSSCPDYTCSRNCQSSGNHKTRTPCIYLCATYDQHAWPKQVMSGIRTTADSEKQQCYLCPPTGTGIILHLQLSSSVIFVAWLVHCKGLAASGVNDGDTVLEHCGVLGEGPPEVLLCC